MLKTYSKLFQNTIRTISNWKLENRPIIALLEQFSKEELEEFLENKKIYKYELIKDMDTEELEFIIKNKGSSNERLHELLKFFSISDSKVLGRVLASSLRNNGLDTGTAEYLDRIPNMQQLIYTLRNILNDRSSELKKNSKYPTFEQVIRHFNENVGFDFSENDELTLSYILGRYRVYNTLYNFENTTKTSFV
jgi:hypothetical protein